MAYQLQQDGSAGSDSKFPIEFVMVCVLAFIVGISTTAYFCRTMGDEMGMPGGWKMSMMWMKMPGQTWLESLLGFILMWLAMMLAMMMPSALPTFLKTRRGWASLCYMASGYFTIWLIGGIGIYLLGMVYGIITMRSPSASRAVPLLSGALLIATGLIQFTRWKMTRLLQCRSLSGCGVSCTGSETSFRLGCKQGMACCVCCAAPMTIQLVLGIMNPLAMIGVATVIAAEKLLPRPDITARITGIAAILAGPIVAIPL